MFGQARAIVSALLAGVLTDGSECPSAVQDAGRGARSLCKQHTLAPCDLLDLRDHNTPTNVSVKLYNRQDPLILLLAALRG